MRLRPADTCYVCNEPASSDEHVPARCFFPDDADLRKALITVRSCTAHNQDTSKDDQYVRTLIAMAYGGNPVGAKHFRDRVRLRLEESPGLARLIFGATKPVLTPEGPSHAFRLDRARFDRVMRKIGYGIYRSERGIPWSRELIVFTADLRLDDLAHDDFGVLACWANSHPDLPLSKGANPEVFQYRLMEEDGITIVQLIFYGGFTVWLTAVDGSGAAKV